MQPEVAFEQARHLEGGPVVAEHRHQAHPGPEREAPGQGRGLDEDPGDSLVVGVEYPHRPADGKSAGHGAQAAYPQGFGDCLTQATRGQVNRMRWQGLAGEPYPHGLAGTRLARLGGARAGVWQ